MCNVMEGYFNLSIRDSALVVRGAGDLVEIFRDLREITSIIKV
jgi:hypothetical protein